MLPQSKTSNGLSLVLTGTVVLVLASCLSAASDNRKKRSRQPTPSPKEIEVLRGHGGIVKTVAFHPNGQLLYSGGHDAQVIGWNISKAGSRKSQCHEVDRRQSGERISSLAFNKNGNVLAVSGVTHWGNGFGSALKIFTQHQEKPLTIGAQAAWSYTSCDVDPRGNYVAMGGRNNLLRVVALSSKKTRKNKVVPALARKDAPGIPGPVLRVACHPKRPIVAAAGEGGWISLYEVTRTGLLLIENPSVLIGSKSNRIVGLKFSVDGRHLIAASSDHHISVYENSTGKRVRHFAPADSIPQWIDVHPKYNWIVVGYEDKVARIVDFESKKVVAQLKGHDGSVKSAAFSADGKFVATGSEDQTVRIWDLQLTIRGK